MHTVLEGIVPTELSCNLQGICVDDRCTSLDMLNKEMSLLWRK